MRLIFRIEPEKKCLFIYFSILEVWDLNFHEFYISICGIIIPSITSAVDDWLFFCQKTTTLQDHKFKRKWRSDTKMLQQLNISYLGFLSQTHRTVREVKGPSLFLSFPPINEHSNNYSPFCIWDEIRLFLTAADVTARHLLSNIYQPLEISI